MRAVCGRRARQGGTTPPGAVHPQPMIDNGPLEQDHRRTVDEPQGCFTEFAERTSAAGVDYPTKASAEGGRGEVGDHRVPATVTRSKGKTGLGLWSALLVADGVDRPQGCALCLLGVVSPSVPARKQLALEREYPPTKASAKGGRDELDPLPRPGHYSMRSRASRMADDGRRPTIL
jgi:hypothetical protein